MIAGTDIADAMRNVLSRNVSRLNTERRSSRVVNEKRRLAIANVVSPIVRASSVLSECSAPAMMASVVAAITKPAMTNQVVSRQALGGLLAGQAALGLDVQLLRDVLAREHVPGRNVGRRWWCWWGCRRGHLRLLSVRDRLGLELLARLEVRGVLGGR